MPRKPIGDSPMTPAERQRRLRKARKERDAKLTREQRLRLKFLEVISMARLRGVTDDEIMTATRAVAECAAFANGKLDFETDAAQWLVYPSSSIIMGPVWLNSQKQEFIAQHGTSSEGARASTLSTGSSAGQCEQAKPSQKAA